MMESSKLTLETFDNLASLYQERFMELTLYNESYNAFCKQILKPDASILEIGCGPGNITRYMLAKRPDFRIHGIDLAPSMIRLAIENNPTASFEVMDCRYIKTLSQTFDGIVCGFCTPYLSKEECLQLFKDAFDLMNNNGTLYLSTIEGDYNNSQFETSSNGKYKAFVYYYDEDFLTRSMEEAGFEVILKNRVEYKKSESVTSDHLIYIAQKNKSADTL